MGFKQHRFALALGTKRIWFDVSRAKLSYSEATSVEIKGLYSWSARVLADLFRIDVVGLLKLLLVSERE